MQINNSVREEFMKLYEKRSCLMMNSPKLVNSMQKVKGVKPERGCYPGEDWIALVKDMNLTLRKWNSSLGPKSVFEYENGQVICNSRNIMKLGCRGLCRPTTPHLPLEPMQTDADVKVSATVAPQPEPKLVASKAAHEAMLPSSPETKPANFSASHSLLPTTHQTKSARLFALAERIGELTSHEFALNYPMLFLYYKDLDAMSFQDLFDRDELCDFWTGPVWKDGEIIKERRILWYRQPLRAETATLAIQMCTRTHMDVGRAKWLCMYFNNTGCRDDAWCCNFHHVCLYCGSKEHGFSNCERARNLYQEAHKFKGSFGLDPLDPSSKWDGKTLEMTLLKLVKSEHSDALRKDSGETAPADYPDPLLSWYLSETESTTEDASKISGVDGADVADLSPEHPEEICRRNFHIEPEADQEVDPARGLDPNKWTVDEVAQWLWNLEGDKHRRYVPKFTEELINGKSLRLLTQTDLKEDLEVKELRNRKVIFEEIQKLFQH